MSAEPEKSQYTHEEMLAAAQRMRGVGYSSSGRKLKRRTVQPAKEREQLLKVLMIVGFLIAAIIAGFATWYLTRGQAPMEIPKVKVGAIEFTRGSVI